MTVFIAWNGENKAIAEKVAEKINNAKHKAIVGGEAGNAGKLFVGETIMNQMKSSDAAIIIAEKTTEDKNNDDTAVISGNIMYEWGFINAWINDPSKVHIYLINTNRKYLPSDVQGCWAETIKVKTYKNQSKKDQEFNKAADTISMHFLKNTLTPAMQIDKLLYLKNWDKYKHNVYNYDGFSPISDKLLYGMQAAVYTDELDVLIDSIKNIKNAPTELQSIIKCAVSILSVFKYTSRLNDKMSNDQFIELKNSLKTKYEDKIQEPELKIWCEIMRKDKLELCYEYAPDSNIDNPKKHLNRTLKLGKEVVDLLEKQIENNPADKYYGALYLSFQYRNIAILYHRLNEICPEEYPEINEIKYRKLTFEKRKELIDYYRLTYREDSVYDYLLQEYILSMIELYPFINDEEDIDDEISRDYISSTVKSLTEKWENQIKRSNYIYNTIKEKVNSFKNDGDE